MWFDLWIFTKACLSKCLYSKRLDRWSSVGINWGIPASHIAKPKDRTQGDSKSYSLIKNVHVCDMCTCMANSVDGKRKIKDNNSFRIHPPPIFSLWKFERVHGYLFFLLFFSSCHILCMSKFFFSFFLFSLLHTCMSKALFLFLLHSHASLYLFFF